MFKSRLLLVTLSLFLLINTQYFWEGMLGGFAIPLTLVFAITFLILVFQVFHQIYLSVRERFRDKQRIYRVGIVIVLLTLVVLRPFGLINYRIFESKNVFVAEREGVANCMTTLMLKESGRFKMRSVCFGVEEETGSYTFNKDTLKLNYASFRGGDNGFKYGILDTANKSLKLYRTALDTLPIPLYVSKNEIKAP
ncbi:hypothetical protein [Mucilaginibacter aquariorum]|uniref:Uncharacterized protein n=1 Tax=Mucilaginibacter aquariorum TaxID=2967225 RepID=A0ABT1SYI0_9SPHI|nr:hypothetical protein [Mucilaginibacter aquariorum]MCQ6957406.1 hypothetical protein [Mucilaginibacter aquariorum]